MLKRAQKLIVLAGVFWLVTMVGFGQTIINNGSGGTNNYTFSGLYTPAPPVLDGETTDACWANAVLGGESNTNRIVNGVFPNIISKNNNINDGGVSAGLPQATSVLPNGVSASFSTTWDLDYLALFLYLQQ